MSHKSFATYCTIFVWLLAIIPDIAILLSPASLPARLIIAELEIGIAVIVTIWIWRPPNAS